MINMAKSSSEEATFKMYRPCGIDESGQEVFELVPLNGDFSTMHSDRQYIEIIGVMVEQRIFRMNKAVSYTGTLIG